MESLQHYGIQGLIMGVCLGAGVAIFKRLNGDVQGSDIQKTIIKFVLDFGLVGTVLGLIYAAIKGCSDLGN